MDFQLLRPRTLESPLPPLSLPVHQQQEILLALPLKHSQSPTTSQRLRSHHSGLGHHSLLPRFLQSPPRLVLPQTILILEARQLVKDKSGHVVGQHRTPKLPGAQRTVLALCSPPYCPPLPSAHGRRPANPLTPHQHPPLAGPAPTECSSPEVFNSSPREQCGSCPPLPSLSSNITFARRQP